MKDDRIYLERTLECVRRIEEDVRGGRDTFLGSQTRQDAVLRNLQTLSEAAQRVSATLKDAHSDVEGRRIAAFRNVLVHNYLGIGLQNVWDIVQQDVPRLKGAVCLMLKALEPGKGNR